MLINFMSFKPQIYHSPTCKPKKTHTQKKFKLRTVFQLMFNLNLN